MMLLHIIILEKLVLGQVNYSISILITHKNLLSDWWFSISETHV